MKFLGVWTARDRGLPLPPRTPLSTSARRGRAGRKVVVQHKPAAPRGGKEAGIPLEDILYVKGLVGRLGPEQLHTLIDAFAR